MGRVLLIGHRGAGGEAPENTMPAFQAASDLGLDGIEMDVLRCASGELVVVHDLTLRRVTGKHEAVGRMTWPALRELDVGRHFHERFRGERIPLLSEVLDAFGRDLLLDIELKGRRIRTDGIETEVIRMLHQRGIKENVILSSFNPFITERVRRIDPEFKIGYNYLHDWARPLRFLWFRALSAPYSMHPHPTLVNEKFIQMARACRAKIMPWAVNDEADIRRMLELGVDGIMSDYPSRLKRIAGGKGEALIVNR